MIKKGDIIILGKLSYSIKLFCFLPVYRIVNIVINPEGF